ncbi:MAG: glutamate--cysteine ligase, partial [Roseiarcus sp.]
MARDVVDDELVDSRKDLVSWLEAGCKPAHEFRVGAEHEKIPFYLRGNAPVPYAGPSGIGAL